MSQELVYDRLCRLFFSILRSLEKFVSGDFIGQYPKQITKQIRDEYQDCVITNIKLNSLGAFSIGTKMSWKFRPDIANLEGVIAIRKNGEIIEAYSADGKLIYKKEISQNTLI